MSGSLEKICFVKCDEVFQYEEENEIAFSNGSTSLAQVSFSNMKSKLARFSKIMPDPISVILRYWVFHKLQIIERGPKAGWVVRRGELYRYHTYF